MRIASIVGLALCMLAPAVSFGQAEHVLKGKEITESALVDALVPEEPVRTRSIKIMREGGPPPAPAKPAVASRLITFETASAELTPHAKRSLDVVGRALNSNKLTLLTSAFPSRGMPTRVAATNTTCTCRRRAPKAS